MKKKTVSIVVNMGILVLFLLGCTPSESVIQTAIASTAQFEEQLLHETQTVEGAIQQKTEIVRATEEAIISQTQTAKDISYSQTQTAIPKECTPVGTYYDVEGDTLIDYLDILKVESSLDGDHLTATFFLKTLPEEITINGSEEGWGEYAWGVEVDVDHDLETGGVFFSGIGIDYSMALFHFSHGPERTGPIEVLLKHDAQVWRPTDDGGMESFSTAIFSVDYEENSITIKGKIPDINEDSLVYFYTDGEIRQDYLCE